LHQVPKHHVLWWRWGNAVAIEPQTMTTLAFSRQTTVVAVAINARLKSLGSIAHASTTLPHSRPAGAAGTTLTLRPGPPRNRDARRQARRSR
jgi:hypothetical protein